MANVNLGYPHKRGVCERSFTWLPSYKEARVYHNFLRKVFSFLSPHEAVSSAEQDDLGDLTGVLHWELNG